MKYKGFLTVFAVFVSLILLSSVFVLAVKPDFSTAEVVPSNGNAVVSIPENAVEVSPGVFDLGVGSDVDDRLIQGYAFVHYKNDKGSAKPEGVGGGKNGAGACYTYIANGAKWRNLENWSVNPSNSRGLNEVNVFSNLDLDIGKWEDAADGSVDGNSLSIIGSGNSTSDILVADTSSTDGKNEVYFADVSGSGAIAVTIVWYTIGSPKTRQIVEWDQVYDDVDYDWSLEVSGVAGKMDFENIATHELGHTFGMGDLYDSNCANETMYGYASEAETNKRTLEAGDIEGVSKLY